MYLLDASSIIHAWDNYPVERFQAFWTWMSAQIVSMELGFPRIALEEVKKNSPECHKWLKNLGPHVVRENSAILQEAVRIQGLLGIQDGKFRGGVGEADLVIIATAKVTGCPLLSDEAIQPRHPTALANYKIPAVCGLKTVGVQCWNVLRYIKEEGGIF